MPHITRSGPRTASSGLRIETFTVLFTTSGAITSVNEANAGFVTSVAKTSTGVYTVTVSAPLPQQLVTCFPQLDSVSATTAPAVTARYQTGSYDATAGTFIINTSAFTLTEGTPNTITAVAADPVSGTRLNVTCLFQSTET